MCRDVSRCFLWPWKPDLRTVELQSVFQRLRRVTSRDRCQNDSEKEIKTINWRMIWDDFKWFRYLEEGISGLMFNPVKSCKVHIHDPTPAVFGEAQDKELKKMQQRQMRLCSYAEKLEPRACRNSYQWMVSIMNTHFNRNGTYLFILIYIDIPH